MPGIYRKFENDSTVCGKLWVLGSISLRYVGQVGLYTDLKIPKMNLKYAFASNVFSDEQSKFLCDPGEIGIRNLCFSEFSPLSLHRFWSLQIIATSMLRIEMIIRS